MKTNLRENILLFILFFGVVTGGLFIFDYFGKNRIIIEATENMSTENHKAIIVNDSLNHIALKNDSIIIDLLKKQNDLLKKK